METGLTRLIYNASPIALQNLYASFFGWSKNRSRYGEYFRKWSDFFVQSRSWNLKQLQAYQKEQLRHTLEIAYEHVPFYRRRFSENGLHPKDIKEIDDLCRLPVLQRDELREAGMSVVSKCFDRKSLQSGVTGGSTGGRLRFYWSEEAGQRMFAFYRARDRIGFPRGCPYATFASPVIVPPQQTSPPYWRINYVSNQVLYSVYHIGPDTADAYLDDLAQRHYEYYEGYPTPIFLLANFLLQKPRSFIKWPKAIFCTSEELQPHFRKIIETAFHTRVFNQYGQIEKVCCISEYPCGHMHYDLDFGLAEFVKTGITTSEGLEVLEIIATSFCNDAAPLIRYRVGDLVVIDPTADAKCDYHAGPIIREIYGRTGQVLIGKSGRFFHNITSITRHADHIRAAQCVQEEIGKITIKVIPQGQWTKEDHSKLQHLFYSRMGNEMDIAIQVVDVIEKSPSGKTLTIISKLK